MKKRIVSALLALCLLASLGTVSALAAGTNTARTFSDVTDLDTAAEIESLQLLGVLDGFRDGSFRPAATLTRAQAAAMIGRTQEKGFGTAELKFTDSAKIPAYASFYIQTMVYQGILSGYEDGSFGPGASITRGQMAKILYHLL